MDHLWIPITIGAAFFQALRTALQRFLKGRMSTTASTFTRFAFGFPFALLYLAVLTLGSGWPLPSPGLSFFVGIVAGGVAQIFATALLLHVLGFRNFPVGVAYSKTEVVQAAVFGFVMLGDVVTWPTALAIAIGTAGVMLISVVKSDRPILSLFTGLGSRTAVLGMGSGAMFGVAAVGFRGASLSLGHDSFLVAAAFTLVWATGLQTVLLSVWLGLRHPDQFAKIRAAWRPSLAAGVTSVLGSGGWFTAMTIQTVAHVRTLGLIELVFTFALSALWFRERSTPNEVVGIALLAVAIALILNAPAAP